MDDFEIRTAKKSDLPDLREMLIYLQECTERANPYTWEITEDGKNSLTEEIEERIEEGNSKALVAEGEQNVLGFASGKIKHQEKYRPEIWGQISRLFVKEEFRRNGIGRSLVEPKYTSFTL